MGPKARADRGLMIYQDGGQVERIRLLSGEFPGTDETYEVQDFRHGWMCSCADHMYTASVCKHIQAVEFESDSRTVIKPHDPARCKFSDSDRIVKKGKNNGKQQYGCKCCGKRFVQNLGFGGRWHTPEHITLAVKMVYDGMSTRKTATALRKARCVVLL